MADALFMFIQMVMVLAVWSYLYKDNIISRASAQIVVSISTVYFFLSNYQQVVNVGLVPIFQGKVLNIVPIVLGALLFTRLIKGYGWVSSYSYAVMIGLGTGATLSTLVSGSIITRIVDTVTRPFAVKGIADVLGAWITIIGVIFSLSYWLFTVKFQGPLRYSLKFGRIFLMFSIGLLYAEDVLWSQSLFVGAAQMVVNFFKVIIFGMPI